MGLYNQSDERSSAPVPRKREGRAVLDIQSGLAIAATRQPNKLFYNLHPLLWNREWLNSALGAVLDNTGARTSGVDGMCGADLHEPSAKARFIEELRTELKRQTYRPSPVLRKYIPKANGGRRPIGIPTIRDRVVQMVLKMVLEPIFEADFLPNSNGFRPERSTLECVLPLYQYGNRRCQYHWVIEGDIEGCFDNIDHGILMQAIEKRIADPKVLWLIRQFLRAPVVEEGVRVRIKKGTPQGGVLSPLLANIYLNEFDQYWHERWGQMTQVQRRRQRRQGKANCVLFRYADDFILSAQGTREQVALVMDSIRSFFEEKLRLNLSTEKTRVVPLEEGIDFLGFNIQLVQLDYGRCVRICPTQKNQLRLRYKLLAMLGPYSCADDPLTKIMSLNRVLRGWANYYKAVNAYQQFQTADWLSERLFRKWYSGRHRMGVRQGVSELHAEGRAAIIRRGPVKVELFRMTSIKSMHTAKNPSLIWKYRSIRNPYLKGDFLTIATDEEYPIPDVPDVRPMAPEYDEIYLNNRIMAFGRDGWKCTRCGSRESLQAHHIEPVPKGVFDSSVVHRVENLQTLCTTCHGKIPKAG